MTQPTRPPRARWLSIPMTIVVLSATMLIPAASAAAAEPTDMVLEWNANAINAIQNANGATPPGLGQVPPLAPVNLAIVQAAIYDAVNSTRTPDQDTLANWIVVNPFGPVNQAFRNLATSHRPLDRRAGPAVRDDEPVGGWTP